MPDDLSGVLTTIDAAHGLPNRHYISDATHAEETGPLFFDTWAGIGFASALPAPGDAHPVSFLGMPLVMVRDRDGALRVFQNTCRHRGMILVDAPRNIGGVIRCPYHSWCYALTGDLVATPHVGGPGQNTAPGIDRATLGLVEVPSHVWRDVVFVNVNGNAPPFETAHAALIARWGDFAPAPVHPGGADSAFALDVACNWKLAVENYCESYHLPWVHPGLNSYSRLEDHYHIEEDGRFSGQGTRVYRQLEAEDGRRFADFPGLSDTWQTGAEYVALYPNVLLGVHRDHGFAIVLEPKDTGRTIEHVAIHYARPDEPPDMRAANAALWRGVFEEDVFVVEGMQKGRHGVLFDGGRFSPAMDGPTHCFHRWVAARMIDAGRAR